MYKVIWLVRFRRDVPREEVVRRWREEHGPRAAKTPGMIRDLQSHWTSALDHDTQLPADAQPPHRDGHAEHPFEDCDTYRAAMASPQWREAQIDGPPGFDATTLVGGELDEFTVL